VTERELRVMTERRVPRILGTVAASLALAACGRSSVDLPPPILIRYEIAEGLPSCPGCPLTGDRVTPGADGVLVLRLGARYTARSFVRTAGRPDRCIWLIFRYSWDLPSRDFPCTREEVEMTLDDRISAEPYLVTYDKNPRVVARLSEFDIDSRSRLSSQPLYDFPVRFVP
jgi:hypothetical protein